MSWKSVIVVLVLGALAWSRPAHAEKVKTNQPTKLYSRAGEQSPVILKLKSGQSMTVLAKDGRWIKVRVSGRTGWIPRSKVDMPNDDEEIARNTRRRPFVDGRGTRRGFGGESGPEDRIGADATGEGEDDAGKSATGKRADKGADDEDAKPAAQGSRPAARSRKSRDQDDGDDEDSGKSARASGAKDGDDGEEAVRPMAHVAKATPIYEDQSSTSDTVFTAQPRTALYILGEKGKWTLVENDEGDAGFVLTSKLDVAAPGGGPRTRAIDLRGRLGAAIVQQSLATPGGMLAPPDNYTARSSSFTVALGAAALFPLSTRYWVGGDIAYDFSEALPGITYKDKTTGFAYHKLNALAVGGYDLQKPNGMMVLGRLGLHYDSFQVSNVADFTQNTAKIPNQIIAAPMIGAALAIPRLTRDIGLTVSLDTVLFGASVSQTKNLEDGTDPSAKAVYLGGIFNYRWKSRIDLQGTLDIAYTSLSFGGMPPATSMRGHTGTGVSSGSDLSVTASFGIAFSL